MTDEEERTSLLSESLDYVTPRSSGSSVNGPIGNNVHPLTRDRFNHNFGDFRGDSSSQSQSHSGEARHYPSHHLADTASRRGHEYPPPPGTYYSASTQGQMRTFTAINMRTFNPPRVNVSGDPSTNDESDFNNQNLLDLNQMHALFNPSRLVPKFEPATLDAASIDLAVHKFALL